MTGIIVLIILVPIVLFSLLLILVSRSSEQQRLTESLYDRIKKLSDQVAGLSNEIKDLKKPVEERIVTPEKETKQKATPSPAPVIVTSKEEIKPVVQPDIKKTEPVLPKVDIKIEEPTTWKKKDPRIINPSTTKSPADLEKFIGENLANKIGIAVLVLGISFFVKYAIDKDWINETGRVLIGLVAGSILIGIAHRIRNSYRSFSSVLVGGGLTIFYFTIAFAFHQYQLIGQKTAFSIMILITMLAVILALYYDRLELAILATIGGFITPFLVRGQQDNYVALFTYLCILNSGLMVLAWFKKWPSINTIGLFFTTIIFGSWLIGKMWYAADLVDTDMPYKNALLFSSLFYLLFVAMNIVNNIRQKKSFATFDFIIVLSINFLFYLAGIFILDYWDDGKFKGLFTALVGIFNLLLVLGFKQKKTIDQHFIALLTGLALTFISLTAPVEFRGNHVTLFWAAETFVLFWLFKRTRAIQLKAASLILTALMLVSLVLTWIQVYFSSNGLIPIILNKGFTTSIAVSASLFIYSRLMFREADTYYLGSLRNQSIKDLLLGAFIITLYASGALEIFYQFSSRVDIVSLYTVYLQLYSFTFSIILLLVFRRSTARPVLKFLFTVLCLGLYLLNINTNYEVTLALLRRNDGNWFIAHWMGAALLTWLLLDLVIYFKREKNWESYLPALTWLSAAGTILLFSIEMYQLHLWLNYTGPEWGWWENLYYKAGLSILWSLCSFIMMWLGMRSRFRPLRIISLSLFTLTLVKLFVYDIRNIPPGGKIAAFILLGVLLLTVSFMYQRLKKIIIDDAEKNIAADQM